MDSPQAVDGPGVVRPCRWVCVPELCLEHLTAWIVEAAQVLNDRGVVTAQLRIRAGWGIADIQAAEV